MTAENPWLYNQLGSNITGMLVLALAIGLWKAVGTRLSGRIGVIALGVVGVGQFLDGLFRLDCREIDAGCNETTASWHANAHAIETGFTVLGTLVAVFALARAFKKIDPWKRLWLPTLLAGICTACLPGRPSHLRGRRIRRACRNDVWYLRLALVSYRLLRIADETEVMAGSAPVAT